MGKQVELIFFPSHKKFEWPCHIENYWENARIRSSTSIKVGYTKGIYYQTTRVIHWNLLRIATTNAIKWCDVFYLFVGVNKKEKPVMEGTFRLKINIEGHIAAFNCLFRYFKNIWIFLFTLISLNKNIFLPACSRTEKKVVLSEKRYLFHWWHSPSCLLQF